MPRQDGTGPDGGGRPGKGLGRCRKKDASDSAAVPKPRGGGQGAGQGAGRGGGRRGVGSNSNN